jgi:hypothetical protein
MVVDSACRWLGEFIDAAAGIDCYRRVRLELTHSGQLRWFGAMRQGSIDVRDVDHISTDAAPFLWTPHHARGRLIVAFVSDMKHFMRALDDFRTGGESPSEHRRNEPDD